MLKLGYMLDVLQKLRRLNNGEAHLVTEVVIEKNESDELPLPRLWRPIFTEIVSAIVKKDYLLTCVTRFNVFISQESADQISDYIEDYGETIVDLPEDTWDSSTFLWMGDRWNVLIDLWTEKEGHSDLVLKAEVKEGSSGYLVVVEMVYVL